MFTSSKGSSTWLSSLWDTRSDCRVTLEICMPTTKHCYSLNYLFVWVKHKGVINENKNSIKRACLDQANTKQLAMTKTNCCRFASACIWSRLYQKAAHEHTKSNAADWKRGQTCLSTPVGGSYRFFFISQRELLTKQDLILLSQ